jgi:hypothetical protein
MNLWNVLALALAILVIVVLVLGLMAPSTAQVLAILSITFAVIGQTGHRLRA